jgi:hypothetical protein
VPGLEVALTTTVNSYDIYHVVDGETIVDV